MEQNTSIKPNYKKFDIEQDKPFFATYLNTAKQNVFIILHDISESIGLGFDFNSDHNMMDAGLWTYLKDSGNKEPEITGRIIKKLEHHFPFSAIMALEHAKSKKKTKQEKEKILQADPADYFETFNLLIPQLYDYRNFYTHAVHDKVILRREIIYDMQTVFDAARINVKERFSLKTEEVDHLVRLGAKGKISKNFYYNFTDKNGNINKNGIAFFICLWLKRNEAQYFLKKIEGFKKSESPSQKATLEVFTFYSPRIPQPRLSSNSNVELLLLDMVNELKRCPKELYPLLSNDDRDKFISVPEDNNSVNDDDENGYEANPVLKRSSNRFYYFALRYLEQNLQHLKFHIDLGNYCFHVYEQEIEGLPRQRRWIKRMLAFGNLEDFTEEKRPDNWKQKTLKLEDRKVENKDIYMTDTTPHFHINDHNIGIKFMYDHPNLKKENKLWPDLPDFDVQNKEKSKPRSDIADGWLSLFELPSIVFYQILWQQNTTLPTTDKIIRKHLESIRNFFNNIQKGSIIPGYDDAGLRAELQKYELEKSYIPKAVIKYLTSKPVNSIEKKAEKRLNELIAETDTMLDKVEIQEKNYGKRPGSKDYVGMRSGNMADFLARDMIKLQKPLDKMHGKPNGTEFQVLQYKLAYFGANKKTLPDTFKLCNLTESDNPHPFLNKIDVSRSRSILDFYRQYLNLRLEYLRYCIKEKKYGDYHFLKLSEDKHKPINGNISGLLEKYKTDTVPNLPRGLFHKPILEALKLSDQTKDLTTEIEKLKRANTAFIIDLYLKKVLNDAPQNFYSFKKTYEILNKLYDPRSGKQMRNTLPQQFFSTEELTQKTKVSTPGQKDNEITKLIAGKFQNDENKNEQYIARYNAFTDNEKQIRLSKTCDEVLFMMADDIFRKNFLIDNGKLKEKPAGHSPVVNLGEDYKLGSISPESDKGFLSLQTEAKLEIPFVYETNKDKVLKVQGAESVLSDLQIKTIIRENIKIKNYGDFRAFLKDRRIHSLLPYLPENEIHFEALQRELEFYHQARLDVFERIYRFEKEVTSSAPISKEGNKYVGHERILEQRLNKSDSRFSLIKELRNAFNHSNYPAYILFKGKIDGSRFNELKNYHKEDAEKEQKSVVLQFKNLLIQYYDELTEH